MTASSVSTYLDVTKSAASGSEAPSSADPGTDTAAKVLAAIHGGSEVVADVPAKTGLSMESVLSTVAWLSESGLVDLDTTDGALRARLTDPAKAALNSA